MYMYVNVHLHIPRLYLHSIWFTILQKKFTTYVGYSVLHLKIQNKLVNQFFDEVQGTINVYQCCLKLPIMHHNYRKSCLFYVSLHSWVTWAACHTLKVRNDGIRANKSCLGKMCGSKIKVHFNCTKCHRNAHVSVCYRQSVTGDVSLLPWYFYISMKR
jgi:hypothetical protein